MEPTCFIIFPCLICRLGLESLGDLGKVGDRLVALVGLLRCGQEKPAVSASKRPGLMDYDLLIYMYIHRNTNIYIYNYIYMIRYIYI